MLEWELKKVIEQELETRETLPKSYRARRGNPIGLGANNIK